MQAISPGHWPRSWQRSELGVKNLKLAALLSCGLCPEAALGCPALRARPMIHPHSHEDPAVGLVVLLAWLERAPHPEPANPTGFSGSAERGPLPSESPEVVQPVCWVQA